MNVPRHPDAGSIETQERSTTYMQTEDQAGSEDAPVDHRGQRTTTGRIATALRRRAMRKPREAYYAALEALQDPPGHEPRFPLPRCIVGIYYDARDRVNYFTGVGLIIRPSWVATCAHIFSPKLDMPHLGEPPTAEKEFYIRVGDPKIQQGERHDIAEIVDGGYRFPFGPAGVRHIREPVNDIALVRLATPTAVEPATIATDALSEGDRVTCVGWPMGLEGPGVLTPVSTTVIPSLAGRGGLVQPNEVCVANSATAPLLNGYSGGPAFLDPPADRPEDPPLLAGLVSRGADVGDDDVPWPGILTSIAAHREFIRWTTGE